MKQGLENYKKDMENIFHIWEKKEVEEEFFLQRKDLQ